MEVKPLVPIEASANFFNGIKLCIAKPHVLNRQLAGAEQVSVFQLDSPFDGNLDTVIRFVEQNRESVPREELLEKALSALHLSFRSIEFSAAKTSKSFAVLNKLISKNLKSCGSCYEIVVVDAVKKAAAFLPLNESKFNRPLRLCVSTCGESDSLHAEPLCEFIGDNNEEMKKIKSWLTNVFMKKVQKWMNEREGNAHVESLSLVNLDKYNERYNLLKQKYGEEMVKVWPEKTDPAKFVYEDVAIASYLLLIWEEERKRKGSDQLQSFVDLGCGNGLLVYILSSEGHRGMGIDLRKRGIWDLYPASTVLRTEAITPSDNSLFPDVDWIIGNHSDELSPWIPVIAARSAFNCRYFLLPCCAFEFNGKRFQRRNCKKSQYLDFLDYVERISTVCGFETKVDRLKIPSTKRICVIGLDRLYESDSFTEQSKVIQGFINVESGSDATQNAWSTDFEPRAGTEKVQNCTKVDKTLEQEIVSIAFNQVIAKKRFVEHFECKEWNIGGRLALSDIIREIPRDKLKALKSECGGLQTLLKNNSQVFKVCDGKVEIRLPVKYCDKLIELRQKGTDENDSKRFQFKQRPCWFLLNHPNGCPLTDDDCTFKH